jgi:hypothetical protein
MKKAYKILFKFATRSRADKFFEGLDNILEKVADKNNFCILVSADADDLVMNNKETIEKLKNYLVRFPENIIIKFGSSKNKIDAINRDVNEIKDRFKFDILINFSDDMRFIVDGFDNIIRDKFNQIFPDTNGNVFFNDGFVKDAISTMSIIGRAYYDKFNYIYHPSYKSLWCDNEYTEVAKKDNKIQYYDEVLYKHFHPSNIGGFIDEQLRHTESFSEEDFANYEKRKLNNFKD